MTPLISIIVPCYNQKDYIIDTLQSIYSQTYTNWECIIMNDGSTDESEEFIQNWLLTTKDSRFKYYYKNNGGVCETRNYATQRTTGEYILPLDGDDKLHQSYIEEVVNIITKQPDIKLVYCDPILFGAKNEIVESRPYNFEKLLVDNTIPCTAVFRRADFEKTKGYNINMIHGLEDWDFWISLLDGNDKVIKLEKNLVYYRIKETSRSTLIKEEKDKNEEMLLQMFKNNQDKYLQYFNPVRDHINHIHYKETTKVLQQSAEYKIGKLVCYPFRLFSKIWRKLLTK